MVACKHIRASRTRAHLCDFSVFYCHIVTFSFKALIMNVLRVTKSVTVVTDGDNGFSGLCHT